MLRSVHVKMLRLALEETFSSRALKQIIKANIYQDRPSGQIGHDEYHFDNNALEKSYAYIEEQRTLTISCLRANDAPSAWSAFGRLTHTAQDFYSHSNYIDLWLARHPNRTIPDPSDVDPLDPRIIDDRALCTGKIYPLELFSYIPGLKRIVLSFLPRDSHAWMHLDSEKQGPKFAYAFQAAIKRTRIEFEKTTKGLSEDLLGLFVDK